MLYYFVDHKKKKIHKRQFAGDRCGFIETPVENREFTDRADYIEQLEKKDSYEYCLHCQSVLTMSS
ncbi:hypothetical protein A1A1_05207 [Planococcus antarcticus DSM 14505]|uniref:Uncharacterized protein n=1 Tax=Planococcus antarcticus DSM 14505 TaxID=1185653 RepID=A0A1C7DEE8_9BACL|nr:hypothetical protein [Planococcus antarcticus]ANU09818.1 hypothetical protein BBH88_05640 [Planococcus antarcticus DSM 14505]EIM07581.1 hypothetical protein A1A1_05207 [Planococcus antarcticus DSM 14505]